MSHEQWDQRFGGEGFAYGTAPNDFLRAQAALIPPGPVLCLAEGGGRNAVFLAERGHAVTVVDFSREGLRKAGELAAARGVTLELVHADLASYAPPAGTFSGVVAIWAHLPPPVRAVAHARAAAALAPGGVFILEAYTPAQLRFGTGGPRDAAMLYTRELVLGDAPGLEVVVAEEREREVHEGVLHAGPSAVVQVVLRRPRAG